MNANKLRIFGVLSIAMMLVFNGLAKPTQDIFSDIESAIAGGNANRIANYLSSSVEIGLPGDDEGIYSKQQAIAILNRFFDKFPPSSFKIVHQGSSASGSRFAVGDYTTGEEKTFRVTVFIKKTGSEYLIQEVEFE